MHLNSIAVLSPRFLHSISLAKEMLDNMDTGESTESTITLFFPKTVKHYSLHDYLLGIQLF